MSKGSGWPPRAIAVLAALALAPAAEAGDAFTALGDALEIALPLAAAACAAHQHRLGGYVAGFAAQTAVTQGLKYGLGDSPINERPNGVSHGFPSGHTAAAASGATDLAAHCAPGNRLVAAGGGGGGRTGRRLADGGGRAHARAGPGRRRDRRLFHRGPALPDGPAAE